MSSDRDIRDRLAEAYRTSFFARRGQAGYAEEPAWGELGARAQEVWLLDADALLTALQSPTVKLKIEGAE